MAAYTSTALGSPRSGRFAVGDTVTDGAGIVWRCVRSTSPRQWIAINDPASRGSQTQPTVSGMSVAEWGNEAMKKTVITFADPTPFTITNALAYLGTKVYTFPEGRILMLGATGGLFFAVPGDRTDTTGGINVDASLTWGLGTATATNIALTSTMVDLLPIATKVLPTGTAYTTVSPSQLAASAHFDGTGGAKEAFLNFAFATDTQIDNNAVLQVKGSITMVWTLLGDV